MHVYVLWSAEDLPSLCRCGQPCSGVRELVLPAAAMEIRVMPDLQPVLREFTKAVLRDMPTDVLAYSKEYFVEKAAELRMESYQLPPSTSKPFQELSGELQQQIENVFKRYDIDMDGTITIEELKTMMEDLGGLFGFSGDVDASTIMALLDADGDKTISWQVPRPPPAAAPPVQRPPRHAAPPRAACPPISCPPIPAPFAN